MLCISITIYKNLILPTTANSQVYNPINDLQLLSGSAFVFRILILQVLQNSIGSCSSNKQKDSWSKGWIQILDKEVIPCFGKKTCIQNRRLRYLFTRNQIYISWNRNTLIYLLYLTAVLILI